MEQLAADASFGASIALHLGDFDMDHNVGTDGSAYYGGWHTSGEDAAYLEPRLARSLAAELARYALPSSPVSRGMGGDTTGPEASGAWLLSGTQDRIEVSVAPNAHAPGLAPLGRAASTGTGWTMIAPDGGRTAATAAEAVDETHFVLTMAAPVTPGSALYYGYGSGRFGDAPSQEVSGRPP